MDAMSPRSDTEAAPAPKRPLVRRLLVGAAPLLVLLAVGGAIAALVATQPQPEKKKDAPRAPAVQVALAEPVVARLTVTTQGPARPRTQIELSSEVGGRLVWTSPALLEGGAFGAGEALARVAPADYELALARARSEIAAAQARLTRESAEAELAREDWAELGGGRPASPLTLRQPQVAEARAALAAAQAQAAQAQRDLGRTTVRAPFAGRTLAQTADVGQQIGPGAPVATVFATGVMEVRVPLTDADLAALELPLGYRGGASGPKAELTADIAGQTRRWTGTLARVEAALDERTRLAFAIIEVPDPFGSRWSAPLAPGVFVTARIDSPRSEAFIRTPRGALRKESEVLVVRADDTVEIRTALPARSAPDGVYFRAGLNAGERVIVSALATPKPGLKVQVMNNPGGVAPSPPPTAAPTAPAPAPKTTAPPPPKGG